MHVVLSPYPSGGSANGRGARSELEQIKQQHAAELKQALEQMRQQHAAELEQARQQHTSESAGLRMRHASELERLAVELAQVEGELALEAKRTNDVAGWKKIERRQLQAHEAQQLLQKDAQHKKELARRSSCAATWTGTPMFEHP